MFSSGSHTDKLNSQEEHPLQWHSITRSQLKLNRKKKKKKTIKKTIEFINPFAHSDFVMVTYLLPNRDESPSCAPRMPRPSR